jgi:hypothetical protein
MVAGPRLTLGGFLARFALAVLVVGATYNPTPYSYYAWVRSTGFEWSPPTVFGGVVLLIGWFICVRLALRSMGGMGLLLANAFLAALYWLVGSWGWLPISERCGDLVARAVQRRGDPGHRHVVDALAAGVDHAAALIASSRAKEDDPFAP